MGAASFAQVNSRLLVDSRLSERLPDRSPSDVVNIADNAVLYHQHETPNAEIAFVALLDNQPAAHKRC